MMYSNTHKIWESLIKPLIPQMLKNENENNDDYEFVSIDLKSIKTSAETELSDLWVDLEISLGAIDKKSGQLVTPVLTTYYILSDSRGIYLANKDTDDTFALIWDIDSTIEDQLIKAILNDMVEINEMCLIGLSKGAFDIIFKKEFLNKSDFSDKAIMSYYEQYDDASILSAEVQDIFLF